MRSWIFVLCTLLCFVGCEEQPQRPCDGGSCPYYHASVEASPDTPVSNPPFEARQQNWVKNGSGSCFHASTITALVWQDYEAWGAWWRKTYGGGESVRGICEKLDAAGIDYAVTTSGDEEFLRWATRTRRIIMFPYYPNHAINIVELNDQYAVLLDNNRTGTYIPVPRAEFLSNWRNRYGGCAITVIGTPPPPPFRS